MHTTSIHPPPHPHPLPPPQYSFYSTFVHCEIVVCCPTICADLRGSSRHSYLRPHPQRSTGGHVRSLVGCHHKETRPALLPSHFGRACSDSTYAGHYQLRPLVTTVLVVKKQNIKTVRRCVENAQAKTKNTKNKKQSPWWDGETEKAWAENLPQWKTGKMEDLDQTETQH